MTEVFRRELLRSALALGMLPLLGVRGAQALERMGKTASTKTLLFDNPAAQWLEAVPVGNGRVGAMVFGGVASERIQLNHIELWSGRAGDNDPKTTIDALAQVRRLLFAGDRRAANDLAQERMMAPMNDRDFGSYQMLGDLMLTFDHGSAATQYSRELDLGAAEARVDYRIDGADYSRTVIASHPDAALLVKLETTAPAGLSLTVGLSRARDAVVRIEDGAVVLHGRPEPFGVEFCARLICQAEGGSVSTTKDGYSIVGARSVILKLTAATDMLAPDPVGASRRALAAVKRKQWPQLVSAHRRDYGALFDAVELTLGSGETPADLSDRLAAANDAQGQPALVETYFNFGRYLLISSSRPGSLPPNLQGLWADGFAPPWSADYHININLQMNFWPAEACGLGSLHASLFDYAERLKPFGERTAQIAYGCRGAVAHYTSNPWGHTALDGKVQYGLWPEGLAWLSLHFWEHYLHTQDRRFLAERGLPFLKSCAEFTLDYLVAHPQTGRLVSGPASSPENSYRLPDGYRGYVDMGTAMAQSMAYTVLRCTADAAAIVGQEAALAKRCEAAIAQLQRLQIGPDGRLLEWSEPLTEHEPGHRHISHLFGLYPGIEIDPIATPDLAEAARRTLIARLRSGGGHTGWSAAWLILLYARLGDGNAAGAMFTKLLSESTAPNLLDTHPWGKSVVFQIDGNLGATAGVLEMLVQSHGGRLRVLPALPSNWQNGTVRGVRARGGLVVDMAWRGGRLTSLTLRPERSVKYEILLPAGYNGAILREGGRRLSIEAPVTLRAGRKYTLDTQAIARVRT